MHSHIAFDVAWEYSSLGETSIAHSYLVDACHMGSQIFTLRSTTTTNMSESRPVLRTSPHTRQSQPVSYSTSEAQPVSRTSDRNTESQAVATEQIEADSWDDPFQNPCTCHMSKGRFQQLCVMLHFNNNEDTDRLQNDSLHKIRPLLNIVKKIIGHYAELGSEFSFDEATMACYSRYARKLQT